MRFAGFNVAGNNPFRPHRRIVLVGVADNRIQGSQCFTRICICAGKSSRCVGVAFESARLIVRRIVKICDGLRERVEKIGRQVHGKKLGFHRRGVLQKLAGGGQQCAVSAAARHPEFGVQPGRAQIRQRVRAFADGFQLVVQVGIDLRFGFGGLPTVALGGKLAGGLRLRLWHGGGDFGKLLRADASGGKSAAWSAPNFFTR